MRPIESLKSPNSFARTATALTLGLVTLAGCADSQPSTKTSREVIADINGDGAQDRIILGDTEPSPSTNEIDAEIDEPETESIDLDSIEYKNRKTTTIAAWSYSVENVNGPSLTSEGGTESFIESVHNDIRERNSASEENSQAKGVSFVLRKPDESLLTIDDPIVYSWRLDENDGAAYSAIANNNDEHIHYMIVYSNGADNFESFNITMAEDGSSDARWFTEEGAVLVGAFSNESPSIYIGNNLEPPTAEYHTESSLKNIYDEYSTNGLRPVEWLNQLGALLNSG